MSHKTARTAHPPGAELCPSCLARLNAELERSGEFSGAVGTFCNHRLVARLVLLYHGSVCDVQTIRSASPALAQARFGQYLAELSITRGAAAATVTVIAV